jgi:hypothetical protein
VKKVVNGEHPFYVSASEVFRKHIPGYVAAESEPDEFAFADSRETRMERATTRMGVELWKRLRHSRRKPAARGRSQRKA